jgi:hypothetical protein
VQYTRPLAIDLFCGLGGWTDGLLALGYRVVGYDIEAHEYWVPDDISAPAEGSKGTRPVTKRGWTAGCAISLGCEGPDAKPRTKLLRYPAELVLQDVLTIHGAIFKDAALIVASPPCQFFSYTAMPWSRAKALAAEVRADPARLAKELALFNACFRIQREASEAAGRHIPMVVENVRGAIPWVGRSRGSFGSFHLWGDVPALMPTPVGRSAVKVPSFRFDGQGGSFQTASVRRTDPGKGARFTSRDCGVERLHGVDQETGVKIGGDWFSDPTSTCRRHGSKSKARKAASAMIAKIPDQLSRHIGMVYWPDSHSRTLSEPGSVSRDRDGLNGRPVGSAFLLHSATHSQPREADHAA